MQITFWYGSFLCGFKYPQLQQFANATLPYNYIRGDFMNLTQEAFSNPQKYRNLILQNIIIPTDKKPYQGKSFICVSFTRFCPVGCSFCFFSSSPAKKEKTISDALTEEGIEKFISFANNANLGYLLVSGGGEPFLEQSHLLKVIEKVKSDKIVLVTSGNWAKSINSTANFTSRIYDAFKKRKTPTQLVIRLSVDLEHAKGTGGLEPAYNLISLFEKKYLDEKNFRLQFHSIFDDPCIDRILKHLEGKIVSVSNFERRSDGDTVLKVNPSEKVIEFSSGLTLKVGYAKIFYSSIKINLNDPEVIKRNLEIFQWDMSESEENNPSIVTNLQGGKGLDFWVNFNGNVTTWGNQVPDNIYNLYEDDYQIVVDNTFADPISLAYLEKGDVYRDRIIKEVNSNAVIRAKATNIRDYTGAIICEEEKTRLYFTVRILQDYFREGKITEEHIQEWPEAIRSLVQSTVEELQQAYKASEYCIVDQYINREQFDQNEWMDFLELIRLDHYDLSLSQIEKAVGYYNEHTRFEQVVDIAQVRSNPASFYHEERIIAIKESVLKKYNNRMNHKTEELLVSTAV